MFVSSQQAIFQELYLHIPVGIPVNLLCLWGRLVNITMGGVRT